MATYLLTWNPNNWHSWLDDLGEEAAAARDGEIDSWSCLSKGVEPGDRVFLLRQGREPKGIFASGVAVSEPFFGDHWDGSGRQARFIDVKWDTFRNPTREPILSRDALDKGVLGQMHWRTQASGILIPEPIATALERAWKRFLNSPSGSVARAEASAIEGARKEALVFTRSRSRALRDKALAAAAGSCEVCGRNYGKLLGGAGKRVLQVHHKKQLALRDTPKVTKLADLAVVCANCHLLLHADPARTLAVKELRLLLRGR